MLVSQLYKKNNRRNISLKKLESSKFVNAEWENITEPFKRRKSPRRVTFGTVTLGNYKQIKIFEDSDGEEKSTDMVTRFLDRNKEGQFLKMFEDTGIPEDYNNPHTHSSLNELRSYTSMPDFEIEWNSEEDDNLLNEAVVTLNYIRPEKEIFDNKGQFTYVTPDTY